jgi:ubiquinone/menaquinone biosynthesis C-methylase UbiE
MRNQIQPRPNPAFIAQQLRRPNGAFAQNIAEKMDQVNEPLFDLTLETMQLADNESILEIGFGSGKFFPKIFSRTNQLQVSGIDYSQEIVDMAVTNNRSLVDTVGLILEYGSSAHLPFPNHAFDKVFCNMVVYFWEQPAIHLKEIRRVLKPSGQFYTGMRTKDGKTYQPVSHEGVSPKMLCDRIATSPKRKLLDQFIGFCSKLPGSRLLARSFQ